MEPKKILLSFKKMMTAFMSVWIFVFAFVWDIRLWQFNSQQAAAPARFATSSGVASTFFVSAGDVKTAVTPVEAEAKIMSVNYRAAWWATSSAPTLVDAKRSAMSCFSHDEENRNDSLDGDCVAPSSTDLTTSGGPTRFLDEGASTNAEGANTTTETVHINTKASDVWWLHYPSLIMVIVGFILSPILCVLMYLRRDKYPFNILDVRLFIFNEMLMPFTVWQGAVPVVGGGESLPCWFELMFWDMALFPTMSLLLYSIFKLWLDSKYNQLLLEEVNNVGFQYQRKLSNSEISVDPQSHSSWIVRHYSFLKSFKFIALLILPLWGYTWLGIIPRAIRVRDHWNGALMSAECSDFLPLDNALDLICSISFCLATVLASIFLLKNVKEVFNMKSRFIRASLGICFGFAFVDSLPFSLSNTDAEHFAVVYGLSIFCYAFGIHLYTWFLPFSMVRASYKYEKENEETLEANATKRGSRIVSVTPAESASKGNNQSTKTVSKTVSTKDDLKLLLAMQPDLIQVFMLYLVQEMCVENIRYLKDSNRFGLIEDLAAREKLSAQMMGSYISEGAAMELNVSASLKKKTMERFAASKGGETQFWDDITTEVYKLLVEPFQRFQRRKLQGAGGNAT